MLVHRLSALDTTREVLHLDALGFIAGGMPTWRADKTAHGAAHEGRVGVLIGLEAPTSFALGDTVQSIKTDSSR